MKNLFLIITAILLIGCTPKKGEIWTINSKRDVNPYNIQDNGDVIILEYKKDWVKFQHINTGKIATMNYSSWKGFSDRYHYCDDCKSIKSTNGSNETDIIENEIETL